MLKDILKWISNYLSVIHLKVRGKIALVLAKQAKPDKLSFVCLNSFFNR